MQQNELISIIVPIYNVEKYLKRCIDSIVNQTYKKLEIILVDDGSTDKSSNICDNYAKEDNRIKVIHKKNGGISETRNIGIENCQGKFIGFVDPDDYIGKDLYNILHHNLIESDSDISICNFKTFEFESIDFTNIIGYIQYNNIDALKELIFDKKITSHLWNKLYKKELFDSIKFPLNKIYEDLSVMYLLFYKSKKIVFSNSIQYGYYQRANSLCNSKSMNENKAKNYIEAVNSRYNFLKENCNKFNQILLASRVQSLVVLNYVVAKSRNHELYNNKIMIDDYKKNIKIKFNFIWLLKKKFLISAILLKFNRNLFYKIFSK